MIRTAPRGRIVLVGTAAVLALVLSACFGGEDDTEGPTSDTGGAGSNTVVTLAPPPPPVTATTAAVQAPTTTQPPRPTTSTTVIAAQLAYTIQDGDTLYSISRQFGVSVDVIIEVNNITNPDVIRAGDTLVIPPPE